MSAPTRIWPHIDPPMPRFTYFCDWCDKPKEREDLRRVPYRGWACRECAGEQALKHEPTLLDHLRGV